MRSDIVRLECNEVLMTPDGRPLAERPATRYVKVPTGWIGDGTLAPSYAWTWRPGVRSSLTDPLHVAIELAYQAQRSPHDPNRVVLSAVSYRVLTWSEAEARPWRGRPALRLDEDRRVAPVDLDSVGAAPAPEPSGARYDVELVSAGPSPVVVTKVVVDALGTGLAAAHAAVTGAPCVVARGLARGAAQDLAAKLTQAGATAAVRRA